MKKTHLLSFVLVLSIILAACEIIDLYASVTITGTVTVTCNGVPLTSEDFINYSNRPYITARATGSGNSIGYGSVDSFQSTDDSNQGKYRWTMEIPAYELPCTVYFEVRCRMPNMNDAQNKMVDKTVLINKNGNSHIDLGTVNYEVLRIWGNLPLTVNGEPFDPQQVGMYVRKAGGSTLGYVKFTSDWEWSLNVLPLNLEEPLEFIIEADKNGGVFRKTLNADYIISSENGNKIIFSDYPSGIDFEAFALSGTMEVDFPPSDDFRYWINFYNAGPPTVRLASIEVTDSQPDENSLVEWGVLIPIAPLPLELQYRLNLFTESLSLSYNGSIVITEAPNLSGISLGTFVVN